MAPARSWAIGFLGLGILGLLDAGWLTVKHFTGGTVPCFVTSGCDTVTTSSYSEIYGVPVALLGALNYLVIIGLSLLVIDTNRSEWLKRLAWWTWLGFLFTAYLTAIQAFVLEAYCIYCLISAGLSTGLFILGHLVMRSLRRSASATPTPRP